MSAFVGRVDELGVLDEVGRAASAGEVAAAIVVGDAGCGKSRLLAEAADRSGRSSKLGRRVPFPSPRCWSAP